MDLRPRGRVVDSILNRKTVDPFDDTPGAKMVSHLGEFPSSEALKIFKTPLFPSVFDGVWVEFSGRGRTSPPSKARSLPGAREMLVGWALRCPRPSGIHARADRSRAERAPASRFRLINSCRGAVLGIKRVNIVNALKLYAGNSMKRRKARHASCGLAMRWPRMDAGARWRG